MDESKNELPRVVWTDGVALRVVLNPRALCVWNQGRADNLNSEDRRYAVEHKKLDALGAESWRQVCLEDDWLSHIIRTFARVLAGE